MVPPPHNHSSIAENLDFVSAQIKSATLKAGRQPGDITLIAVSKTRPMSAVQTALAAGQIHFGENTIQDARSKIDALTDQSAIWHFIGHLQTNKAKYLPARFQWLHTLDSIALAKKINTLLLKADQKLNALIQVNISNDSAKHGIDQKALPAFIENMLAESLGQIELRGLMTIGKLNASMHEQSNAFSKLRELREKMADKYQLPEFTELSMGMSRDYEQAIAAGSTMVRVGSHIFGERVE